MAHTPTKNNEFTTPDGSTGILVSFTKDELDLLGYYCPPKTSFPTWIRSLVLEKLIDKRIETHD